MPVCLSIVACECVCAVMYTSIESFIMSKGRNDWKLAVMIDNPSKWYILFSNSEFPEYIKGCPRIHV